MTTSNRSGTACDPLGPDSAELGRLAHPHAWRFAHVGYVRRHCYSPQTVRSRIANARAEVRATLRAGRDVGAPHTWPVFDVPGLDHGRNPQ